MTRTRALREITLTARFLAVGALNSAVHAGLVLLLGLLLARRDGWIAILIAWGLSLPVGYLTQALLVWKRPLSWGGFARLCVSQVPSIAFSTGCGAIVGSLGMSLIVQEGVALVTGAIVSFVLQRFWVFRGPSASEAPEADRDDEGELAEPVDDDEGAEHGRPPSP